MAKNAAPFSAVWFFWIGFLFCDVACAHTGSGSVNGFLSGLAHPVLGLDHIVAMVAVGLWGAWLGAPAIWLLPVVFPMVMAVGGVLGIFKVPVPGVEILIAASGVVLGASVLTAFRPPLWVAAAMVGLFAVFHGYAHGAELPGAQSPVGYCVGFVLATGMIHLSGIGMGLLKRVKRGEWMIRSLGAGIAVTGTLFLFGVL
ncbi:MAG: HupE/UreJ family protein [Deltaproteobacteria bacterium]|nr:HupE/UreJ family protein [Deltaproteobacteria bacterium]